MKKTLAALSVAALAAFGVVASATPANAHTSAVTGVAECQEDGTYTVTWTYNATNVPDGVEAETKAMTTQRGTLTPIDGVDKGGQIFLSVWAEHQINVPGAPVRTGNWTAQFATVGIPGDAAYVTTMVQTDWKGGPSEDPVGRVDLPGDCEPEEPPVVVPPKPEPETVVRDEIRKDCEARTITRIVWTSTTGEPTYDEATNTWTQGEYGPEVETDRDVYPATPEDCPVTEPPAEEPPVEEPPTEEPPVEEPPVVEPPTEEPPVTEPPVVEPPVEETPAPVAPKPTPSDTPEADLPPALPATGSSAAGFLWVIGGGAVAVILIVGSALILGRIARNRDRFG